MSIVNQNAITKIEKSGKIKVAFIGDSVTYGHFLDDPITMSFPGLIKKAMPQTKFDVQNFALSGTTLTFNGDEPYVNSELYQQSLRFNPDVVVIMLGTNDSKPINFDNEKISKYKSDAVSLINSYRSLESAPIIYFNTSPVVLGDGLAKGSEYWISNKNVCYIAKLQREVADENDTCQIDIYDKTQYFTEKMFRENDGVHPGAFGHQELAKIILNAFGI
ncbi:MAG: GDSL-type esterase/lipase family protein [Oscillospiraceae bacterium]